MDKLELRYLDREARRYQKLLQDHAELVVRVNPLTANGSIIVVFSCIYQQMKRKVHLTECGELPAVTELEILKTFVSTLTFHMVMVFH